MSLPQYPVRQPLTPIKSPVDAVVRLIDRYLAEEANHRNLQSDKQTIHPRDLPPQKREALISEIFEILNDARK